MGKGGLNRLLLSQSESIGSDPDALGFLLPVSDPRVAHIRTFLAQAPTFTLRVAIQPSMLHDAAVASLLSDGSVLVLVPHKTARTAPPPTPIALVVAMQRPKVIGRILESAAAVGVAIICIVAAEKVEKSYWDCKLFRDDQLKLTENLDQQTIDENCPNLPGRPRGKLNHPHRDLYETSTPTATHQRRVDQLPSVRRRLVDAVQQASADATPPIVLLERRGLTAVLDSSHPVWDHVPFNATRVVAHPYRESNSPPGAISRLIFNAKSDAAVIAIGPEAGWTENEIALLSSSSFSLASLGSRVLRSETAALIALGLVHEGLRLRHGASGRISN